MRTSEVGTILPDGGGTPRAAIFIEAVSHVARSRVKRGALARSTIATAKGLALRVRDVRAVGGAYARLLALLQRHAIRRDARNVASLTAAGSDERPRLNRVHQCASVVRVAIVTEGKDARTRPLSGGYGGAWPLLAVAAPFVGSIAAFVSTVAGLLGKHALVGARVRAAV